MGRRTAVILGLLYAMVFMGQSLWRATFHNLAIQSFQIDAVGMGAAFSLLALPGLLSALVGLLGGRVRMVLLVFVASAFMGTGLMVYGLGRVWGHVLWGLILLHMGFAVFHPTTNAIFLSITHRNRAVQRLSFLRSMGPLSGLLAAGLLLLALTQSGYRFIWLGLGGLILVAGGSCYISQYMGRHRIPQNFMVLDPALLSYYGLHFLNGCRSGVFKTFVLFYLISEFGFQLEKTATIVLLGNLMTFLGYQFCSRISLKFPPGRILMGIYGILVLNFFCFYFVKDAGLLSLCYLLDSFVFFTPAVLDGYLKFVSPDENLLGNIATGVTLFHLGGVIMPFVGGLFYARIHTGIFFVGSLLALASLVMSMKTLKSV